MKQTPAGKVRLVTWQIDQVVDELPLFMTRLEEFTNMLEEKLDFAAFKFCFVAGATVVVSLKDSNCYGLLKTRDSFLS